MNTVQHTKKVKRKHVKHYLRMNGPINARDMGDFIWQVRQRFLAEKGRAVGYDDDYFVETDADGITAVFKTDLK